MTTQAADQHGDVFTHPALMYHDAREYLQATLGFIHDGLDRNEPVMAAVPPWNLALLRNALGDDAARLDMCDMSAAGRNPGRIIGDVLLAHANRHPGRRVRVIGKPMWAGRSEAEYPACVQHEALINVAFAGRDATILCPYDVTTLPPVVIRDARRTHPTLWVDGTPTTSADYTGAAIVARFADELTPVPSAAQSIPVDRLTLAGLRAFANQHATAAGLSRRRAADAVVVVNELATNSLVHGIAPGNLATWTDDVHLIFQVQDGGRIEDPLAGRRPVAPEQIGGRGLMLAHRLSDLMRIHSNARGTSVRAYFAFDEHRSDRRIVDEVS